MGGVKMREGGRRNRLAEIALMASLVEYRWRKRRQRIMASWRYLCVYGTRRQ